MTTQQSASEAVLSIIRTEATERTPEYLRDLLAYAASGLTVIEGAEKTAMGLYQLADVIAVRGERGKGPPA